jgi:hypothetical protein
MLLPVAALAVAGCVSAEPIKLSSKFAPSLATQWTATAANGSAPCDVMLDSVRDTRADPQIVGALGRRIVRADDAAAWVRSGFETLRQDSRIRFVAQGDARPALGLSVELLKVYVSNVNMAISSSAAVRVSFTSSGAPAGQMVFRGADNVINWSSGDGEVQGSLDRALQEIIVAVNKDVLARCSASPPSAPAAAVVGS